MKNLLFLFSAIAFIWITTAGNDVSINMNLNQMDLKEKTGKVLDLLKKRTFLQPSPVALDPRLQGVKQIPRNTPFSTFNKDHLQVTDKILKILNSAKNFDDFLNLIENLKSYYNSDLPLYVLYSSVFHRDDTQGVYLPPIEEAAPHWFFAAETIHEAIQLTIHHPHQDHVVVNQKTAEASEPESKLAYFREDVGFNTHHWTWHMIYPISWDAIEIGIVVDRKGEFFYYMHHQMLARYISDRKSNGLPPIQALNFYEKLEGYAPHLCSADTGIQLGTRPEGLVLRDVPKTKVKDLKLWRDRILEAINHRAVRAANGSYISLQNERGIDILGAIVGPTSRSVNYPFYGDLHNKGHDVIAQVQDPDGRYRQPPSVMYHVQTASRDPVFYRWHQLLNDIFVEHLNHLPPYTKDELYLPGVNILDVKVIADGQLNLLKTFFRDDYSDLSHAPFLKTKRKVWVKYERLDHRPFTYLIDVVNWAATPKDVTFRIFLAPKFDDFGNLMELNEQRKLMIELDKFHMILKPGPNSFYRDSIQSSVTRKHRTPSFSTLVNGTFEPTVDYCNCGWPQHMLIPKGSPLGMDFVLFIMGTDHAQDTLNIDTTARYCSDAVSYCGLKNQKYPDTKPMGYPFDRFIPSRTLKEFLTLNMMATDVKIMFMDPTINVI